MVLGFGKSEPKYVVSGNDLFSQTHIDRPDVGTFNHLIAGIQTDLRKGDEKFSSARQAYKDRASLRLSKLKILVSPLEEAFVGGLEKRYSQLKARIKVPTPPPSDLTNSDKTRLLGDILRYEAQEVAKIKEEASLKAAIADNKGAGDRHDAGPEAVGVDGEKAATSSSSKKTESSALAQAIDLKIQHGQFEQINNDRPLPSIRSANNDHNIQMVGYIAEHAPLVLEIAHQEASKTMTLVTHLPPGSSFVTNPLVKKMVVSILTEQNDCLTNAYGRQLDDSAAVTPFQQECHQAMKATDDAFRQVRGDVEDLAKLVMKRHEEQALPGSDWHNKILAHLDVCVEKDRDEKALYAKGNVGGLVSPL